MELVQTILGSTAVAALISALVSVISTAIQRSNDRKTREEEKKEREAEKQKEKSDILRIAINLILLRNLQTFAADLISKDAVWQKDLEQFEEMYKTYKALDGDGFADRWRDEINKKPIVF